MLACQLEALSGRCDVGSQRNRRKPAEPLLEDGLRLGVGNGEQTRRHPEGEAALEEITPQLTNRESSERHRDEFDPLGNRLAGRHAETGVHHHHRSRAQAAGDSSERLVVEDDGEIHRPGHGFSRSLGRSQIRRRWTALDTRANVTSLI